MDITKQELEHIEIKIKRFEYGVNPGATLVEKLYASYLKQQSIITKQAAKIAVLAKDNDMLEEVVAEKDAEIEKLKKRLGEVEDESSNVIMNLRNQLKESVNP